jgi:hypothetical protein
MALGLALLLTDILVIIWTPFAIAISAVMYLIAVLLGLLTFSWLGFGFSLVYDFGRSALNISAAEGRDGNDPTGTSV